MLRGPVRQAKARSRHSPTSTSSYSLAMQRKRLPAPVAPMTRKDLIMIAPDISIQNSLPDTSCGNRVAGRPACCAAEEATFIPYHAEDESSVLCWDCHGYIVGPPGRRLCHCQQELEVVSPAEAEKLRALAALRDALAETYRRRWFRVLMPLLDDAE